MHQTARKDVALILLQIVDEGTLTDSQGRKVDFKVGELLFFEFHLLNSFYRPEYDYRFILVHFFITVTPQPGSDILARPGACDRNGVVTTEAREQVPERASEFFPSELFESFGFHDRVQLT